MNRLALFFGFAFAILSVKSQGIQSSNTYIQTKYHHAVCFSVNNSSYLFYDESKQTLYLKIDFSKFKSGQDSLDEWLDDLSSTNFYFKAELDKHAFDGGFSNSQGKSLKLNGQAFLNGVWHNHQIDLSLFSAEAKSGSVNPYEQVRANFGLAILPKDFKIHKKPHHLKKVINIGVTLGRINLLSPDMVNLLKEVYDHH